MVIGRWSAAGLETLDSLLMGRMRLAEYGESVVGLECVLSFDHDIVLVGSCGMYEVCCVLIR